ncbi:MAG: putative agmatine deiminase [Candidatus Pelagibacterales bacterium]|nr:MAG: putative agmatine deiminase [Pelagibacterales bacterium]
MKLIPEWYEHQYCLIAWPCNKDLYGKIINKARDEVANVINEIAKTEHVIVLSNKEDINEIQNKTDHKNIDIIECKLDDSWMRDIAPIFYNENEKLKSISFEFNGYGKYPDYLNDNKISKFISNYLNIPTKISDLVIEGGAITYDDKKNLFSTKNVIFNKNRKQKHNSEYIIKELKLLFDLNYIFLFENGLMEDDTDGHVDNLLCPIGKNQYLIATTHKLDPNYEILEKNKADLIKFFRDTNQTFDLIEVPLPTRKKINNKNIISSYINFYFSKNKIILPKFNVKEDNEVKLTFEKLFPNREIMMLETENINYGGGNIHCITMNVPKI